MMDTQAFKEHKQHAFDSFCKTVLRNKALDLHKQINHQKSNEVSCANVPEDLELTSAQEDTYNLTEPVMVKVLGQIVPVQNQLLGNALKSLLPKYRDTVFLSAYLEYSDTEIARLLDVPVTTINYRKKQALKLLRERMRGFDEKWFDSI